jgi:hypothetical protein
MAKNGRGGERAGSQERTPTRGPRNGQQAQGKDPHRGEPAGGPTA